MATQNAAEQALNSALKTIFEERGVNYAKSGLPEALQQAFRAAEHDEFRLVEKTPNLVYRLRDAISLAAGFDAGDKLALVRTISLKEEVAKHDDVATAVEGLLFGTGGLAPHFVTRGLFAKDEYLHDLQRQMADAIHDHTLDGRIDHSVREHLGLRLIEVYQSRFGTEAGSHFADGVETLVRTMIYAALLNKKELRDRCGSALRVAPGTVLLGCKVDEKRSVKEHAACYVLTN